MAKKVKDTPEASRMIVSPGYRAFTIFNDILIGIICLAMLYPFLYLIAQSFSSTEAIVAGKVGIVPVGFLGFIATIDFSKNEKLKFTSYYTLPKKTLTSIYNNTSLKI